MKTTSIGKLKLAYEVSGSPEGEPVILVHGGVIADAFKPIISRPELADYRLVHYHRRGYGSSDHPTGASGPDVQAGDAIALLDALGLEAAHFVGHSAGGAVALQAAIDAPERVYSLSLFEPYLVPRLPGMLEIFVAGLAPIIAHVQAGDLDAAYETFVTFVGGPDAATLIDKAVPNARAQAKSDLAHLLETEFPGGISWTVTDEQAAQITSPVLTVLGAETDRDLAQASGRGFMGDTRELILRWFPSATDVVLPRLNHLLQMVDPAAVAGALADFLVSVDVAAPAGAR